MLWSARESRDDKICVEFVNFIHFSKMLRLGRDSRKRSGCRWRWRWQKNVRMFRVGFIFSFADACINLDNFHLVFPPRSPHYRWLSFHEKAMMMIMSAWFICQLTQIAIKLMSEQVSRSSLFCWVSRLKFPCSSRAPCWAPIILIPLLICWIRW